VTLSNPNARTRLPITAALLVVATVALAGTPVRLTDVTGMGTLASGARLFVRAGNYAYFRAEDADRGWELWRTDGTSTERVTDVVPGPNPPQAGLSQWFPLAALGNTVYFHGWDAAHGWELWKTNGEPGSTQLVKDLTPGPIDSNPQLMTATSTLVFFTANAYPAQLSLFITDGSEAGTIPVKGGLYNPVRIAALNEKAFILNFANGANIWWISDGTAAGTGPFEGVTAGDSEPWRMRGETVVFGGGFTYFTSCSDSQGCEVWQSDGTQAGTRRLTNLVEPSSSTYKPEVQPVAVTGTTLFVHRYPSGPTQSGPSLWAINLLSGSPTELGAYRADVPLAVGNTLYFRGPHSNEIGYELWRSDGSQAGTVAIDLVPGPLSSYPTPLGHAGGTLYLRGSWYSVPGQYSSEQTWLWASDGTLGGSARVLQLVPSDQEPGGNIGGGLELNGKYVFGASELTGRTGMEPWISDGTAAGTTQLRDVNAQPRGVEPGPVVALGSSAYAFSGCDPDHGCELWESDGTPSGTTLAADIYPGPSSSYALDLTAFRDEVYFRCQYGYRLCRYDGAEVQEVLAGGSSLREPYPFAVAGSSLFFGAYQDATGRELWRIDSSGAPALVKDINAGGYGAGSSPYNLTPSGGALFFVAYNYALGEVIWKSDGTEAGTTPMKSGPSDYWNPYSMAPIGSEMFFRAGNQAFGAELWKTDGTAAGTALFKDINTDFGIQYPGYPDSSAPYHLTAAADRLFFTAYTRLPGRELWTSDGTVAGTELVKDIVDETPYYSTPDGLGRVQFSAMSAVDDILYFTTWQPATGVELWRSDGTEEGTVVVRDIVLNGDAHPADLLAYAGTLFLSAWDLQHGRELWQTDGTEDGTVVVADLADGERSSSPTELSIIRGQLFYSANDGITGRELWRMPLPGVALSAASAPEGGSTALTATATDPEGAGLSYAWDLDGDGDWDLAGVDSTASFSAAGLDGPGTAAVRVRVADATGVMAVDRATVTIENVVPVVSAGDDVLLEPAATLVRPGGFTDPGPDAWTATVDYGDNSGVSPLTLAEMTFTLNYTYMVPGIHTVTVVITDDDGGQGFDSFTVDVGTSDDWIDDLIDDVGDLLEDGSINGGQANSLSGKLEKALEALQAGNVKKAITMLEAFINEVEAFIRGGVLTNEEGDPLLAKARAVLASLT
jgi:ELWxxDGT repeat protein